MAEEITERPPGAVPGATVAHSRPGPSPRPARPVRRRRKPALPELLRPFIQEARERHKSRPASPGVVVTPTKESYRLEAPHRDLEAWEVQIADAFGTRSYSTICVFLDQLSELCPTTFDGGSTRGPDALQLNAVLNIVNGVRPRNEMEAALALQMCAIHLMTMKMAAQGLAHGYVNPSDAALTGKLARTFAQQMDTLNRVRGKVGKQSIKVRYERHEHRHVHVGEGGSENGTRALAATHAIDCIPAGQSESCAPLRSPDPEREPVPTGGS